MDLKLKNIFKDFTTGVKNYAVDYLGIQTRKHYASKTDEQLLDRLADIAVKLDIGAFDAMDAIVDIIKTRVAEDPAAHASLQRVAETVSEWEAENKKISRLPSNGYLSGSLGMVLYSRYKKNHPPATAPSSKLQ